MVVAIDFQNKQISRYVFESRGEVSMYPQETMWKIMFQLVATMILTINTENL